jgi:hypothetical protein
MIKFSGCETNNSEEKGFGKTHIPKVSARETPEVVEF